MAGLWLSCHCVAAAPKRESDRETLKEDEELRPAMLSNEEPEMLLWDCPHIAFSAVTH